MRKFEAESLKDGEMMDDGATKPGDGWDETETADGSASGPGRAYAGGVFVGAAGGRPSSGKRGGIALGGGATPDDGSLFYFYWDNWQNVELYGLQPGNQLALVCLDYYPVGVRGQSGGALAAPYSMFRVTNFTNQTGLYFAHWEDAHGSVRGVSRETGSQTFNGAVDGLWDYRAFGAPLYRQAQFDGSGNVTYVNIGVDQEPFSLSNFAFNGQWNDVVSNLYYLRNRYYDCFQGRFITRDPVGLWYDPANLGNGFTYCANQPTICIDPWGFNSLPPEDTNAVQRENAGLPGYSTDGWRDHIKVRPGSKDKWQPTRCEETDSCATLVSKTIAFAMTILHEAERGISGYGNVDAGHMKNISDWRNGMARCMRLYAERPCPEGAPPTLPPIDLPIPVLLPDPSKKPDTVTDFKPPVIIPPIVLPVRSAIDPCGGAGGGFGMQPYFGGGGGGRCYLR